MKRMSLGRRAAGLCAVALIVVGLASATSASAASTRAEYIAQVDPICQSYAAPLLSAFGAYHRNFKRLNKEAKSGTVGSFVRAARRTARSLNAIAGLHANEINQIAAVPPVPADAPTVNAWLTAMRQEQSFETAAVTALLHFRIGPFFRNLNNADGAADTARSSVQGFGFQVCEVTVS
jgi:hypothetical protein